MSILPYSRAEVALLALRRLGQSEHIHFLVGNVCTSFLAGMAQFDYSALRHLMAPYRDQFSSQPAGGVASITSNSTPPNPNSAPTNLARRVDLL